MKPGLLEVALDKISLNPYQPRKHFCQEELEELAASIKDLGIIQPPVVRPTSNGHYELISGERRFRAAKMAALEKILVIVSPTGRDFSAEAALVENIQRVDLNPIEIASALKKIMTDFDLQQEDVAEKVGKKRSTVANYLRLLSLPKKIQDSLNAGEISMGHAKAILSCAGFEKQLLLHARIIESELSVREAEKAAEKIERLSKKQLRGLVSKDCYLQDLEEKIQLRLGTKVAIRGFGKRGKITIDYYDLDDLERLLEILGVEE